MTLQATQHPVVTALYGEAPEGYEEVLKGDAALARALKRLCAEAGVTLYERTKWNGFGYELVARYAPESVVSTARAQVEASAENRARARDKAQGRLERKFSEAILEQFPHIPDGDLIAVIRRACEVGSGRVGRSRDVPRSEAARLAVVAHVRHRHTDYDEIVRELMDDVRDGGHDRDEYEFERANALTEARRAVSEEIGTVLSLWSARIDLGAEAALA